MRQNAFVQQLLYLSEDCTIPLVSPVAKYVIIEENKESVSHTVRGKGGASCSVDMFL